MISAEEFLRKFKEEQACASVQRELSSTAQSDFELDSALTSALQRGWYLAPVLTRSKYFLRRSLEGEPTQHLAQIRLWASAYSECGCNWVVETGIRSGLLILEFTYDIGQATIRYLLEDDCSWHTTVQFTDQNARFVCFRYSGQRIRTLGTRFPGVTIHLDDCILIPPSITTKASQISYLNPCARTLELPDGLLAKCGTRREDLSRSDNDGRDYIAA